jgi:D-specific alpha-keto acid dehydrogenase
MASCETTRTVDPRFGSLSSASPPVAPGTGLTLYGCGPDEAALIRELAPRLGLVPTITEAAISVAGVTLTGDNRCISVDHKTRVSNPMLLALSEAGVRYLSTRSIGYDHIDLEYAASVGILVENVSYSPDSVADYTLMLMLMVVRGAKATVRRTDAHDYRLDDVRGKELRDLTVGVIGTGCIGAAVIERLKAFGCRVLAHDSCPTAAVEYVSLDALLARSDLVTLHTPLTAETHHLLDGARIERMKPGAFVVNTGRGPLLDTRALLRALEDGHLGGAALDVLEGEEGTFYADCRGGPLQHEPLLRLQQLPNVLISPHTAYYTDHAMRDAVTNSLLNCLEYEKRVQRGHE